MKKCKCDKLNFAPDEDISISESPDIKCKCKSIEKKYKKFNIPEYEEQKYNYKPTIGGGTYPATEQLGEWNLPDNKDNILQWKVEIIKVDNGYICKGVDETWVIENTDGESKTLIGLFWSLKEEFDCNSYLDMEVLKHKEDYTKWDYREILRDVYNLLTNDDFELPEDTIEMIKDIFKKEK